MVERNSRVSQGPRIDPNRRSGKHGLAVAAVAAGLLLGWPAGAQMLLEPPAAKPPLLDPAAVPGLDASGRASYAAWLLTNTPRAVAVGSNGKLGWAAGGKTLDQVRDGAVAQCTAHGGVACRLYAEDLDIVWPGREQHAPAVPGPLASSINDAFVPDERFLWHGPAAAEGVIVWSHGKQGDYDSRGLQPPPVLRGFNNAGFDIVRFDRAPMVDTTLRAAGWLQDELAVLRRSGYRRVVAAGQSRGAWTSLQMLDTPGLVDAVIALSPAAHGSGALSPSAPDSVGGSNLLAQDDDLRALVSAAEPAATRVAVAQFSGDPFMSDADIRRRLIERLRSRLGAVLVIDRPAGLSGHFGGMGQKFSEQYGSCLLRFVLAPVPPAACPGPEVEP